MRSRACLLPPPCGDHRSSPWRALRAPPPGPRPRSGPPHHRSLCRRGRERPARGEGHEDAGVTAPLHHESPGMTGHPLRARAGTRLSIRRRRFTSAGHTAPIQEKQSEPPWARQRGALGPNVDVGTPKSLRPFPGDQVLAAAVELWVAGLPGGSTRSTALAMDGAADLATVTTRRWEPGTARGAGAAAAMRDCSASWSTSSTRSWRPCVPRHNAYSIRCLNWEPTPPPSSCRAPLGHPSSWWGWSGDLLCCPTGTPTTRAGPDRLGARYASHVLFQVADARIRTSQARHARAAERSLMASRTGAAAQIAALSN